MLVGAEATFNEKHVLHAWQPRHRDIAAACRCGAQGEARVRRKALLPRYAQHRRASAPARVALRSARLAGRAQRASSEHTSTYDNVVLSRALVAADTPLSSGSLPPLFLLSSSFSPRRSRPGPAPTPSDCTPALLGP